ncbi:MAG: efflux RND transporter periplasmic adaptor subunit [Leptolyngbyaceae cyanobacterium]
MKQVTPQPTQNRNGQVPRSARQPFCLPLRELGYGALGLGLLLLLVFLFRPAPILVDQGRVQRGTLQVTVNAEGQTRVRDRFVIAAGASGHLNRITLQEGDPVSAGMVVARIDPLPVNASIQQALQQLGEWRAQRAGVATQRPKPESLEQARSQIRAAQDRQRQAEARVATVEAALAQAQRDRQRAQELAAAGAISRQARESAELAETTRSKELDAARLAARTEAAAVEVAQAQLRVLQKQQTDPDYWLRVYDARIASTEADLAKLRDEAGRTEVRSPVAGRVLRILQKSARYVDDGTPLLEIGDATQLELVIDVLSSEAIAIRAGDAILLTLGSRSEPLRGVVRRIEPSAFTKVSALGVEEQRVNVIGDLVGPAPRVSDGYRVDAGIVVWQGKDVVKVPLSALFRCQQLAWCVFVVEQGKAQERTVAIGQHNELEAEVKSGLQAGEVVVLHPTERIKNGTQLKSR